MSELPVLPDPGNATLRGADARGTRHPPLAATLAQAAEVVASVLGGSNLNDALAAGGSRRPGLTVAGRAAVQDLAYGTLRAFGRGDFFLSRLLERPLKAPPIRALLLVALARLEARPGQSHVIVDQAVAAAAGMAGGRFKGLVNGVLRSFLREADALMAAADGDEVARLRHPAWWLARLRAQHPGEWQAIAAIGNGHPPMALRVNCRRATVADYLTQVESAGIEAAARGDAGVLLARPLPVQRLPGFFDGMVSVQDLGAQRAAPLLDARPGMRVLDACAAPGGKCAHLLELADVELTALDLDAARMERVADNLHRLGLGATLQVADCRDTAAWWDGRPFERILADVPCSASGVVRRHPDIKWLRREADIAGFAAQQAAIMEALWQVLAPGGKLLYATCSIFDEENAARVAAFAARHTDCIRTPLDGTQPELELLPQTEHDGFFYALLQKRA